MYNKENKNKKMNGKMKKFNFTDRQTDRYSLIKGISCRYKLNLESCFRHRHFELDLESRLLRCHSELDSESININRSVIY